MTERLKDAVPTVGAQQTMRKGEAQGEAAAARGGRERGRAR